jgi:hypothetical protein
MKPNHEKDAKTSRGHLGVEIVVQVVPQQAVDKNCLSFKVIPALGQI